MTRDRNAEGDIDLLPGNSTGDGNPTLLLKERGRQSALVTESEGEETGGLLSVSLVGVLDPLEDSGRTCTLSRMVAPLGILLSRIREHATHQRGALVGCRCRSTHLLTRPSSDSSVELEQLAHVKRPNVFLVSFLPTGLTDRIFCLDAIVAMA